MESHYFDRCGREKLEAGDIHAALQGIDELIDAMRRSEQRAVRSQLVRLMMHILKWQVQPTYRSPLGSHYQPCQTGDLDSQEETPSITDEVIQGIWDRCFNVPNSRRKMRLDNLYLPLACRGTRFTRAIG